MIYTILVTLLIVAGLLFVLSVLMMSPKGGLGFGISGIGGSNEYWSKKSIETTLKKVANISVIIFIVSAILLPYFHN